MALKVRILNHIKNLYKVQKISIINIRISYFRHFSYCQNIRPLKPILAFSSLILEGPALFLTLDTYIYANQYQGSNFGSISFCKYKLVFIVTLVTLLAFMALKRQNMGIMTFSTPNWSKNTKKNSDPCGLWNGLHDLCWPFLFLLHSLMPNKASAHCFHLAWEGYKKSILANFIWFWQNSL